MINWKNYLILGPPYWIQHFEFSNPYKSKVSAERVCIISIISGNKGLINNFSTTLAQNTLQIRIQGVKIHKKNLIRSVDLSVPRLPLYRDRTIKRHVSSQCFYRHEQYIALCYFVKSQITFVHRIVRIKRNINNYNFHSFIHSALFM